MFPDALDASLVGTYPASVHAGGGYVWDAVLEYRVWCHPERGAVDLAGGADYFYSFATYREAAEFAEAHPGSEASLALVLQEEYIDEPEAGRYAHIRSKRLTEWPVEFLARPRRSPRTISDFFAPDAPPNRLDVIRGLVSGSAANDQHGGTQNAGRGR